MKGNGGVSYNSTSEDGSGMSCGGSWVVSLEVSVTGVRVAKMGWNHGGDSGSSGGGTVV